MNSEIAPARKRGALVVMNHIGMVTGLAVAFWYLADPFTISSYSLS